jgi:sugar O-acyltransferase (sialic acid O-acetyltransferase NeuD family)
MKPTLSTDKIKKLIIFGLEDFADIAYEYFTADSDFEVVGFTAHERFKSSEYKFGIPVYDFETISSSIDPAEHYIFVAITYQDLNRTRETILASAKNIGFTPASYVSSFAFVWKNVTLGEHVFIFENNTIQPFVTIESNVVLWSGNHIGHHSIIGESCFITSHVVISGWVRVGHHCFIGVNSTVANGISIGSYNWINSSCHINQDTAESLFYVEPQTENKPLNITALNRALARKSQVRDS